MQLAHEKARPAEDPLSTLDLLLTIENKEFDTMLISKKLPKYEDEVSIISK